MTRSPHPLLLVVAVVLGSFVNAGPASAHDDGTWRVIQAPPPSAHPYAALCASAGPPTRQEWNHYAIGEPQPKVCR